LDERAVFTAVVYVLTSGCAWRHLPPTFGVSHPLRTAGAPPGRRRACGGGCTARCWASSVGAASVGLDVGDRRCRLGAGERGAPIGPDPVDRGKSGHKLHVLSEAQGIPLAIGVSGANTHDSLALKPLVKAIPAPTWTTSARRLGVNARCTPRTPSRPPTRRSSASALGSVNSSTASATCGPNGPRKPSSGSLPRTPPSFLGPVVQTLWERCSTEGITSRWAAL
jgi:hypothetical protein